jgi:hypothetical protein
MIRRVFLPATLALALTACGGRGVQHVLPHGPGNSGLARAPHSSNTDVFNGTLWYGDDRSLRGVALTYGPSAEIDGSYAGLVGPSSRAMTVSRDGTLYELIQNNAPGANGWQLRIYAPGSSGKASPEGTLSGTGYSRQVFLAGDGIDVLTTSSPNGTGTATLSTFAYSTASNATPIRTAALGADVLDAAIDRYDRIYVAHVNGTVDVYPAAATCTCTLLREVKTGPSFMARSLAVTDNGTVYVLVDDPREETANVLAYAPGNNGPSPSWTYGPFYESADVAPPGKTMSAPTGGIATDAAGNVYVGLVDNGGTVHVEEYLLGQQTGTLPWRTIATPTFSTYLTSIAVGPVLPSATSTPPPTLYVGSKNRIYAFNANASGAATPQRAFGSFYYYQAWTPNGSGGEGRSGALTALAAGLDGTVTAFQSTTFGHGQNVDRGCAITIFSPNANGSGGVVSTPPCADNSVVEAATGFEGEIDYLGNSYSRGNAVVRMVDGAFASIFAVDQTWLPAGLAADPEGDIFYARNAPDPSGGDAQFEVYSHNTHDGDSSRYLFSAGAAYAGPICAAAGGTIAISYATTWGNAPVMIRVDNIHSGAPTVFIGPVSGTITALACDAQGRVYAGVQTQNPAGTRVEVYDGHAAQQQAAPLWTLSNPVPADDPGGQVITALAVSAGTSSGPQAGSARRRTTGPSGGRSLKQ